MRLTPLDIKKQDFKKVMRGIDQEEVEAFLNMLAEQWQEVIAEQQRLERKVVEAEAKLEHYKQVEEALQEALKTARESSRQTLEAARRKAKAIVEEGVASATRIQKKAIEEQYDIRRSIAELGARHSEVIARLRGLLRSEMEILEEHERNHRVSTADLDEIELIQFDEAESQFDEEEQAAVQDMAELEEAGTAETYSPTPKDSYPVEDQDALIFSEPSAEVVPQEPAAPSSPVEPAVEKPTPQKSAEQRRSEDRSNHQSTHSDSPEIDRIRKILDDLA